MSLQVQGQVTRSFEVQGHVLCYKKGIFPENIFVEYYIFGGHCVFKIIAHFKTVLCS
mgnify:CR=1 FL=1